MLHGGSGEAWLAILHLLIRAASQQALGERNKDLLAVVINTWIT